MCRAQTVDRRLSAPRGSLESVLPTRNLQCIPQSVRGRQPPVSISFTRVTCEVVGIVVYKARRGTQHRLPLRVTFKCSALKGNVCSRGLIVFFRSPSHMPGKPCWVRSETRLIQRPVLFFHLGSTALQYACKRHRPSLVSETCSGPSWICVSFSEAPAPETLLDGLEHISFAQS